MAKNPKRKDMWLFIPNNLRKRREFFSLLSPSNPLFSAPLISPYNAIDAMAQTPQFLLPFQPSLPSLTYLCMIFTLFGVCLQNSFSSPFSRNHCFFCNHGKEEVATHQLYTKSKASHFNISDQDKVKSLSTRLNQLFNHQSTS